MRKILLVLCVILGVQTTQAQLKYGVKAGINYNSDSFQEVRSDVLSGAESKTGFHAGVWAQAKIPVLGVFIRPELVYTQLKSGGVYLPDTPNSEGTTYNFRKLDIPVLIGKKVFGMGKAFIGPSFQYVINGDFGANEIKDVKADGFTVGLQLGAGIDISKFGIDVRWERGFSDVESGLVSQGTDVKFDTRVNQIIIGLSYEL